MRYNGLCAELILHSFACTFKWDLEQIEFVGIISHLFNANFLGNFSQNPHELIKLT